MSAEMTCYPTHGIYSLDKDIIDRIFDIRSLEKGGRMANRGNDIKSWSQVCSFWRECALSSPMVWGRLLSITGTSESDDGGSNIGFTSTDWLDEVIKRSGTCPLWIELKWHSVRSRLLIQSRIAYLTDLLNENWHRIESLNIDLADVRTLQHAGDSLVDWERLFAFYSPAPLLKVFRFLKGEPTPFPRTLKIGGHRLFSGNAPSLICFDVDCEEINLDLTASWTGPSIRTLGARNYLPHTERTLMDDLLPALCTMPNLEALDIQHPIIRGLNDRYRTPYNMDGLRNISLPSLKYISVQSWASDCLEIFKRVVIYNSQPGIRSFSKGIPMNYHATFEEHMDSQVYEGVLRSLVPAVFKNNVVALYEAKREQLSWMHVQFEGRKVYFSDFLRDVISEAVVPHKSQLDMGFTIPRTISTGLHPISTLSMIVNEIPYLKAIACLRIKVTDSDELVAAGINSLLHPDLTNEHLKLLSAFSEVTTITITQEEVLSGLVGTATLRDYEHPPFAFPKLTKVVFDGFYDFEEDDQESDWSYFRQNLIVFLEFRKRMGAQISEVEFMWELPRPQEFVGSLAYYKGLKVSWYDDTMPNSQNSMICGGDPLEGLMDLS